MGFVAAGVAVIGGFVLLTGIRKILTRRGTSYRWSYQPPDYAVREDIEQGAFRAFIGGLFRVAIGVAIIAAAVALAGVE
jgi:hypothetical protein